MTRPRHDAPRRLPDARPCEHEVAVVAAVLRGRWAEPADRTVLDHLDACAGCREAAELARLFAADDGGRRDDVRVPGAGQVWWRCAVRARLDATRAAARPISWVQAATAGLFALGLGVAAAAASAPALAMVTRVVRWAAGWPRVFDAWPGTVGVVSWPVHWVALVLAGCVAAASLAVYIAVHDEWRDVRRRSSDPNV